MSTASAPPAAPASGLELIKGIILITAAFLCVAVMSAFGKAASNVPTGMVSFFQSFISLLVFLPWTLRHGIRDIRTTRLFTHIVRALAGLLSQVLYFLSVKTMPLVDSVLLVNAAPLFIPIVALVWMKLPITRAVVASLAVGFVGVVLVIQPGPDLLSNPSSLIALSAALFSAIALVTVNTLSKTDQPDTILFYYFLIASIATAPFAAFGWQNPTPAEWGYLAGIGVMMAAAQLLIILAYQHATASQIAPFNYSVVIFSGIIGWIIWGNVLDWISITGIVLVCAGGIASILLTKKTQHAPHAFALSHCHGKQQETPPTAAMGK